jgi:hypothetical protein
MSDIKRTISFDMLISLMQKNSAVIVCGEEGEPSVHLQLDKDDVPEDIEDAIDKLVTAWEQYE